MADVVHPLQDDRSAARYAARLCHGVHAIAAKELLHILRDRLTLALLVTVPMVQLLLFGFAIDLHPRHLPTALLAQEDDALVRRAADELEALGYFRIVARTGDAARADRWLAESKVQFVLALPRGFAALVEAGERPELRLIADASDPVAALVATQAAQARYAGAADDSQQPMRLTVERRYNPDGASRRFVVPGLLGVVLTLTLVLLGAFSLARERERGSLETLALLPIPRAALLLGKAAPYFALGALLFLLMLGACVALLGLPWPGWSPGLFATAALFIAANLALGLLLSLIAANQMQAMQLGVFFYLPSMLLSGFMFPFHGMPAWARALGELLPLTHFLRVVRGVLLKGLAERDVWALAWPIATFALLAALGAAALLRRAVR